MSNQQYSTESTNDDSTSSQKLFLDFIDTLGLHDKYPQKLTLLDALQIRQELIGDTVASDEMITLPYSILQSIMRYTDYRNSCVKQMASINPELKIHPVDSLIALLHCCSDFLKQDLLSRLATCQIAIPFLLPDPDNGTSSFLLWSMRSIVCEWKCKIDKITTSKAARIVDHKGPIISFVRIGKASSPKSFSKSHMLNAVIGDHQYFFHWNCAGGGYSRKFVDGLVELSVYLPTGKDSDSFCDSVFFLNLRGEARNHHTQISFIKKISFMTFAVLLEDNVENNVLNTIEALATVPGGLVIILPDCESSTKLKDSEHLMKVISNNSIELFDVKYRNDDEVKSDIQKLIARKLTSTDESKFCKISSYTAIAQQIGIKVDEDNFNSKEGRVLARAVINTLSSVSVGEAKAKMLPLQGPHLWQQWAKHDKESYQKPTGKQVTNAFFNQSVEQKKKEIRSRQCAFVSELTPLMKCFITGLQSKNASVQKYFLHWLKMFLDDHSRKILPGIRKEHEKLRAELHKLKSSDNSETPKDLINKLQKQNKLLVEGSLGLEHLFRELGQVYEASIENVYSKHGVDGYTQIIVDILNDGYPFELMDGDASHIPMKWISDILEQLARHHKRKQIFVISVLGIQSTGKSTLLNTMFGLQLNVSAGRCTRGAFLQLVPVTNKSILSKSNCDYILIVDTEGLRAPELSSDESLKHDNELATFVIGIADLTIINIYGEAPGDLNDILQTAAHAFIRMKNVDMQQLRCHFVHQNVTAVCSDSHTKFGQQSFQDRLNQMTIAAAKAEHCESRYHSFQDVIKFNSATDITYFPGLWKGDPPMAPVNPGYSDKALQLKSTLVALVENPRSDSTFANFILRVEKLWSAVCRENYIFSFKNTQEVTAYNELDAEFSKWSWELHRKMLSWNYETGNAISNSPSAQISTVATECLKRAEKSLNETFNCLLKQMNDFFENSEFSGTLAQWRARYEIRLQHLKDERMKEAEKQCALTKHKRQFYYKLENLQKNYRQQLLKYIKDLVLTAKQSKLKLNQQQLTQKFDEQWQIWIEEFSSGGWTQLYSTDESIEYDVGIVVQDLLAKHNHILIPELTSISLGTRGKKGFIIEIVPSRHISDAENPKTMFSSTSVVYKVTKFFGFGKEDEVSEDLVTAASQTTEKFLRKAKDAFRKIKRNFQNFDKSYVFELLIEFIKAIEDFNKRNNYIFTSEYLVDMVLLFAGFMTVEFTKLMQEIRGNNDPMTSLRRLKITYFRTFLDQYNNISGHETAAKNLCQLLVVAIEQAVTEVLPHDIADNIRASSASFKGKSFFKVKVLQDLAKKKDFNLYKAYFEDVRSSFEWWAEQYVVEYCMANRRANLERLAEAIVHRLIIQINTAVKSLTSVKEIKPWLSKFHASLSKILIIDLNEVHDIVEAMHGNSTSDFFAESLEEKLKSLENEVMENIKNPRSKFSRINSWNKSPQFFLCEHLFGCCAQCPFCGEQCELTDSDHASSGKDHYVNIHRPQCLGKFTWDKSKELIFDMCTFSVESENQFKNSDTNYKWVPYKEYRSIYKNWCISNESPKEAPKYWQWFVHKYIADIIQWVRSAPTAVDKLGWGGVSEKDALASLSKVYKIT